MVESSSDLCYFYGNYGTFRVVLNTPWYMQILVYIEKVRVKKQSMQKKQKGQCLENKRLFFREQRGFVYIVLRTKVWVWQSEMHGNGPWGDQKMSK